MLPVEDIFTLLPQRPPFIMVDNLLSANADSARCSLMVGIDNIFVEHGHLNESGLLENMAQTAAAGIGYNMSQGNKPAAIGYIGAVTNFEVRAFPKVGDELLTEITIDSRIFNVCMISGKTFCNDIIIASCQMKVFTQTNEQE